MANITMPFWQAIEMGGGEIIRENGMMIPRDTRIGLEHYPIFDERHRDTLNSHIVSRYYNQEIGHATVSEFRMRLQAELALHMPMFNKMYEANLIEFDPLSTMNIVNDTEGASNSTASNTSTSDSTSTGKGSARNVTSNTPNVRLGGDADYADGLADAISKNDNEASSRDEAQADQSAKSTGKSVTKGYSQSPASLVRQRQELLLNVDMLVVQSLEKLFLGLWNTYDDMTEGYYV